MTIRVGSNAQGHHAHILRPARTKVYPFQGKEPVKKHVGIERLPDRKPPPEKPLTDRHLAILSMVDEEPIAQREIADALHLNPQTVNSGLYALARRGLVERVPYKGWVKSS